MGARSSPALSRVSWLGVVFAEGFANGEGNGELTGEAAVQIRIGIGTLGKNRTCRFAVANVTLAESGAGQIRGQQATEKPLYR